MFYLFHWYLCSHKTFSVPLPLPPDWANRLRDSSGTWNRGLDAHRAQTEALWSSYIKTKGGVRGIFWPAEHLGIMVLIWVLKCLSAECAGHKAGECAGVQGTCHWEPSGVQSSKQGPKIKCYWKETIRSIGLILGWKMKKSKWISICSVFKTGALRRKNEQFWISKFVLGSIHARFSPSETFSALCLMVIF